MAKLSIQPPGEFNFQQPDDCNRWKRRFEQYRVASALDKEEETRQVCTILYCMGEEAEGVLLSTGITEENRKKYSKVIESFDKHFNVRRNVIFERAKFNRRTQRDGKSVEQFITSLYELVELCNYGEMKNKLLRDRIVVGVADTALSERLQLDADLTLEKAKTAIRQKEAIREHQRLLNSGGKDDPIAIEEVRPDGKHHFKGTRGHTSWCKGGAKPHQKATGGAQNKHVCKRCGRDHPPTDKCPAREAVCRKCHKIGHFERQCRTKVIAYTTKGEPLASMDSAFLGAVTSHSPSMWTVSLQVENTMMSFKLDTGAEVTVISDQSFKQIRNEFVCNLQSEDFMDQLINHCKCWGSSKQQFLHARKAANLPYL